MKAWRVHEPGEPRDVLRLDELPDPEPGPGQVLVRVLASAVNFPDALLCRGHYQVKPALPFIAGVELCGEVVGLGAGVTDVEIGQRVIGSPRGGAFCGLTVMDAVASAGGFTYRANENKVYLRRSGAGGEEVYALDAPVPVFPGDNIRIPERYF